jgi:hypothetical protein
MATPPEQPSRPASYGYTGGTLDLARLPIPGNAEFGVYVIALVVLALMAKFDDQVSGGDFVHATTWVTAAYLISRGLAKASRVLEQ